MSMQSGHPREPGRAGGGDALLAVAVAAVALAVSLAAFLYIRHAGNLAEAARLQSYFVEAYQGRAIACLDVAAAEVADPGRRAHAEASLNLSRGITLCLVKHRDPQALRIEALDACVKELEATNAVAAPGGPPRPPC